MFGRLLPIISLLFFSQFAYSFEKAPWVDTTFGETYFVENKGQFKSENGKTILFAAHQGLFNVYFNSDFTLTYEVVKIASKHGEQEPDDNPKKEERDVLLNQAFVNAQWVGGSSSAAIETSTALPFKHHYVLEAEGKTKKATTLFCNAFKKIVFKNMYPQVDIEYTTDTRGGIKYNLILNPGADLNAIKLSYKNTSGIEKDQIGNLIIHTRSGDIIDHAPSASSAKKRNIVCDFILQPDAVQFELRGIAQITEQIIIDPWTTTITNSDLSGAKAYDIGVDTAGNVYVYGGGINNLKLIKYNSFGSKQWTYSPGQIKTTYYGDLLTMPNGECYLSEGFSLANSVVPPVRGAYLENVTSGGSYYIYYTTDNFMEEAWRLTNNCKSNEILVVGGGTGKEYNPFGPGGSGPPVNIGLVKPAFWGIDKQTILYSGNTNCCNDAVGVTLDDNGDAYLLFAQPMNISNGNDLMKVRPNVFQYNIQWTVPSGYSIVETMSNNIYPTVNTGFSTASMGMGMNCITNYGNYVFTYDGLTVKRWDKSNGNSSAFVNVPNGQFYTVGGLAVDACGNVFVGSKNGVYQYDLNLNQVGLQTTTGNVFDVIVGRNGKVYACGNGFVSETAFTTTCTISAPLSASISATSVCGSIKGTATVSNITGGAPGGYTYVWSNSKTTATITGLNAGVYNVTIRDGSCPPYTLIKTVTVTTAPAPTFSVDIANVLCKGASTGSATPVISSGTPPYQYTWLNSTSTVVSTSPSAANLAAGTYSCIISDANGCPTVQTFVITQPASAFLLNTVTTTSLSCSTDTVGQLSVAAIGGVPGYTFDLAPSGTVNSTGSFTNLLAGTYTVQATDAIGCSIDTVVVISAPPPLLLQADSITNESCLGMMDGAIDFSAIGGTPSYSYTLQPGAQINTTGDFVNLAVNTYTVISKDQKGCMYSTTVQITSNSNGFVVANADKDSIMFNGSKSINIYQNDTGSVSSITILVPPINGQVQSLANGIVLYKPSNGFSGNDSLKYVICDPFCMTRCDTTWVYFKVLPEFVLSIPNGFSPDGDGVNDVFVIKNLERFPENSLEIYNRWGGLVYTSSPYLNNWDGVCNTDAPKIGGSKVVSGTYFYILNVTVNKKETYKGYIELRR
ncbi:MAG: gliding motility-associated C-terminal domain-containing protein [Bacteroidetes bacterium]|nr:gliding motility-associated C-terminal domain-containing protein [Bacteroidota bacterium]